MFFLLGLHEQFDQCARAHIQQTDDNAHEQHERQNQDGIRDQLMFARPRNLLQFVVHVLEGLADLLGQVFKPRKDLAQFSFFGLLCSLFGILSRLLNFRHFFHILTASVDVGSLGLAMSRVLLAEGAVLHELNAIRGVFLVLHVVVVALFAFCASQANLVPSGICHLGSLLP